MKRIRKLSWLALPVFVVAESCSVSHDVDAPPNLDSDPLPPAITLSPRCQRQVEDSNDGMPVDLECAGLFSDVASRKLMAGLLYYEPAFVLWSDGAEKGRWLSLPRDAKIDSSDSANWVFPVGTKFFKEFGFEETGPIETRMFMKARDDYWISTTYVWNAARTKATRDDAGKDVDVDGERVHHIPSQRECETCHGSHEHSVLGFSAVSLGTAPEQTDHEPPVTLHTLVEKGMLSDEPPSLDLTVGADATGLATPLVQWFHINCGVSCHNDDQNSEAYSTGLRLKLDPALLDGRPIDDFSAIKSTVGVKVKTIQWADQIRVVPGDPDNSLLYKEINSRGGGKNSQMPPIASNRIDEQHTAMVREWILSLKPTAAESTEASDAKSN